MMTKKKKAKTRAISKMTDKELRKEASIIASLITNLNNTMRHLTFELGVREDKRACESEDPNNTCSHCTCWKRTRELCS